MPTANHSFCVHHLPFFFDSSPTPLLWYPSHTAGVQNAPINHANGAAPRAKPFAPYKTAATFPDELAAAPADALVLTVAVVFVPWPDPSVTPFDTVTPLDPVTLYPVKEDDKAGIEEERDPEEEAPDEPLGDAASVKGIDSPAVQEGWPLPTQISTPVLESPWQQRKSERLLEQPPTMEPEQQ